MSTTGANTLCIGRVVQMPSAVLKLGVRQLVTSVVTLVLAACASAPGPEPTSTSDKSLADQEAQQRHVCERINAQLDMLGVNTTGDPFSWPGYRNRELGDPNNPATEINRLQMEYQRNRCYMLRNR
jgi:hypothetical protein